MVNKELEIKEGMVVNIIERITIPIMPPVLYGNLKEGVNYEVNFIGEEIEMIEVNDGARQHSKITKSQLVKEILSGTIEVI